MWGSSRLFHEEDVGESGDVVEHVAGADGGIVFEPDVMGEIYEYSSGVPRLINLVCDRALLLGFTMETKTITMDMIKRSVEEIEGYVRI